MAIDLFGWFTMAKRHQTYFMKADLIHLEVSGPNTMETCLDSGLSAVWYVALTLTAEKGMGRAVVKEPIRG